MWGKVVFFLNKVRDDKLKSPEVPEQEWVLGFGDDQVGSYKLDDDGGMVSGNRGVLDIPDMGGPPERLVKK